MGAPKQKWTQEEESALRSGVIKHGPGKWRTILKDPDFSEVLFLRSNVDLKDKWRNMSVMLNGWGSREKSRVGVKRTPSLPKQEDTSLAADSSPLQSDEEMAEEDATGTSAPNVRLDSLIMEAISTIKEPGGSNKTSIGTYIEEQYHAPPDFKRLLSAKLKYLTARRKLIKVKRKYRIPNSTPLSPHRRKQLGSSSGKQRSLSLPSPKTDGDEVSVEANAQIDPELDRMKTMSVQEAAAIAAQAVAEAEAAMAAAEEAAKDAELAEAEAEVAQAFAEEAMKTLKGRYNNCKVMIRA
ncbi:telomere repeat-binding factor 1 [Raphanus sativus]|uniref:MYB transcription factor n=1 Tax=Raphanus sativus TaxID=3726 RepID=A0A6J0P109_RAPSA|nr:telomere repeat-binding factor 1 [Raphanus sativus]XP_018490559.1 telomere repeat-binding factor 1 [Raphanus sativus]XP_018490560.1 telomere repeat-binding factor 1 [Raphanus sativus]